MLNVACGEVALKEMLLKLNCLQIWECKVDLNLQLEAMCKACEGWETATVGKDPAQPLIQLLAKARVLLQRSMVACKS